MLSEAQVEIEIALHFARCDMGRHEAELCTCIANGDRRLARACSRNEARLTKPLKQPPTTGGFGNPNRFGSSCNGTHDVSIMAAG